jgi:peroxiredoxin
LSASVLYGTAKDYAGSELIFYRYLDRITFMKEEIFRLQIDTAGDFRTEIDVEEVIYVFGEFGVYHAYFYLEPDKDYELLIPPFAEMEAKDIFNPFFAPERVQIGIKNMQKSDLNYLIMDFDYYYFRYHDLNFIDIYAQGLQTDVDTFINEINQRYDYADNEFFKAYKKYRIASLKNLATQKQYESALVYAYFTKDTVLYENPAYMDLFNNIYGDYFDRYLVSENGGYLYAIINYGHSITRLNKLFMQHFEFRNKQFRELVILKGLNDSFASKNLEWLSLLLTLDSVHLSTEYPMHKLIAQDIADNVLSLAKGTVAPPFELPDTAGNLKKLHNFRGKYVYLHFANTTTYTSQAEFELVKNIYDRYKGYCIFVTVLTDEDREAAKEFMKKNNYNWVCLFTEINSKTISNYKVSAYPTYYFISPNGTLLLSPAPSPLDDFESYLFHLIEGRDPPDGNN